MSTVKPFDFFIQWHLTEKCNLSCRHCYQGERSTDEMPLSDIRKVAAEAAEMVSAWSDDYGVDFSRSMNITGGEPLLRRDLYAVLDAIKKEGFDCYLLTNGTLVTKDAAQAFADLGLKGIQVSVEGPEHVHESIRGKGSLAASAAGIEHLVEARLPVTINVTLSGLNASSMKHIVDFAVRMGATRVGFSRLVPAGRGRTMISNMLSPDEVRELYQSILAEGVWPIEIVTGDPVASQLGKPLNGDCGSVAVSGCSAGVSGLTILPNGDVTPCRRLPLCLGNVRSDSLRELWAASPILEALRDRSRYRGQCGTCSRWAHCRGCRAIAYAWSVSNGRPDFLGDDPQCFMHA